MNCEGSGHTWRAGVPRVHAQHVEHVPEVEPHRRHRHQHLPRRQERVPATIWLTLLPKNGCFGQANAVPSEGASRAGSCHRRLNAHGLNGSTWLSLMTMMILMLLLLMMTMMMMILGLWY